jgi:hypothetical protein
VGRLASRSGDNRVQVCAAQGGRSVWPARARRLGRGERAPATSAAHSSKASNEIVQPHRVIAAIPTLGCRKFRKANSLGACSRSGLHRSKSGNPSGERAAWVNTRCRAHWRVWASMRGAAVRKRWQGWTRPEGHRPSSWRATRIRLRVARIAVGIAPPARTRSSVALTEREREQVPGSFGGNFGTEVIRSLNRAHWAARFHQRGLCDA